MIRGVIFDCFGVLYGGSLETLVSMCPADRVAELHELSVSCDRGYITTEYFFEQVSEMTGKPVDVLHAIASARHTPNQDLIDFAASLRGKVKIGFLSNIGSGVMDTVFPLADRRRLFDAEVLSYDVHLVKPDPQIFELMAEQLGLDPSDCVMVDDLEENCRGAELAGMRAIQHQTNETTIKELMRVLQ